MCLPVDDLGFLIPNLNWYCFIKIVDLQEQIFIVQCLRCCRDDFTEPIWTHVKANNTL